MFRQLSGNTMQRRHMTSEVFSPEELQFCSIIGTALTVSDTPAFQYERPVSLRYVPDHARGTLASPWLPWPHHRRRAHQTAASGAGAGVDAGAGAGADGAGGSHADDHIAWLRIAEHARPLWKRTWVATVAVVVRCVALRRWRWLVPRLLCVMVCVYISTA